MKTENSESGFKIRRYITYLLVFIFSTGIFFSLKQFRRPGGDSREMVFLVNGNNEYQYYYRSPGIFFLHQTFFFLFRDNGLTAENAIALSSATAGGFFVCVLLAISVNPLFLLIALISGINYIYMGHIENYGWVNALLAFLVLKSIRYLEGKTSFFQVMLAWVTASFMHMVAIFYFPAVLFLFLQPRQIEKVNLRDLDMKLFQLPPKKDIEKSLMLMIVFMMIIAFVPFAMKHIIKDRLMMIDVGGLRFVPLFTITNPRHYFTMFSIDHINLMFYFICKSSIIGIPLLIVLSRNINTTRNIFIFIAFFCGFVWAFIWHPDMGRADWDLFGNFATTLNILNGIIVADLIKFTSFENKIKKILAL